jgi:hypothetical protein
MSFIFENNFWMHCQMDYNHTFKTIDNKRYGSLEELYEENENFRDEELYYFSVSPDDRTIGYNFLLSKYKEPRNYDRASSGSKVVKYRVLGTYSMCGDLGVPAAKDATLEELQWTVNNPNVYMMFSKMHIELYEECGNVYRHELEKGTENHKLWGEIRDKYEEYY